jgi:Cu/Ag efflux pump CusA
MLSRGAGSEVMKPIAAPIMGGMITATLLNLIIVPVLYSVYEEHLCRRGPA